MLLKVNTGERTWAMFKLSDHISFGKGDIRYGWCSFPEAADKTGLEEIGLCVFHEGMGAWIPSGDVNRWMKMRGEPDQDCLAILDGHVIPGEEAATGPDGHYQVRTKVRLLNWLVDEEADMLYLFDSWAYILNDDGKTIERL